MSYVSKTLADDEEIITRANFNWTYSFWNTFFFLLGLAPLVVFIVGQIVTGKTFSDLLTGYIVALIAAFFGSLIMLLHMVELWTTEIVVTTYRFVYKTGLVSRNTKEVSLNKIEEIQLRQSIFGRLFGYGSLILRGTGVGVIELPAIDNPIDLRRTIESAKSNLRRYSRDELSGDAD
ncbi:PH domain-containing protein [Aquisalinus flavus]|uniref:Membrane protein n=1 Tax=Aquisalinus flavus TaxID=1526572 RepID=A0A8J2V554_9PROT|nr:PH domain-containing protein [Aquisalinus flavus]MBD0426431.1 PH domain-containing protein [Aquisalinus flavus]UNE48015.1 PH domain-containing protein [Aquisalinus flavus]GGD07962.1 membrane protein [Aquisalinus flavus]